MSRQWRSDDTVKWTYGFGYGAYDAIFSSNADHSWDGSTRFQANGSISGTAGQTSFTKPAGWTHQGFCLLHQTRGTGAGNWELAYVDFSGASAVSDKPLQNTYTTSGASVAQIITLSNGTAGYRDVVVNSGVTLSAPAWNGSVGGVLAIFASKSVTITGTATASGRGFGGGAQVNGTGGKTAYCGEGTHGATAISNNPSGNAGGGGYQNNGIGAGGGGGNGAAGGTGIPNANGAGGVGGDAGGNAALTSLIFGGGGGGGSRDNGISGNGSAGAGGIFIFAPNIIVDGAISLTGTAGQSALNDSGGGGGAGGSCLLKCKTATLGTNKVTAAGGAGGIGGLYDGTYKNGGAGGVGRIHIDYSVSYTGTTSPTIDATNDLTIVEPASFMMMF